MKTTKRILSIALALALGLAVLAPMASATEIDPNAPIITQQPRAPIYLFASKTLNLEVAAVLPEGNSGTLSYAWYDYDWQPGDETSPIATNPKLTISPIFDPDGDSSVSQKLVFYAVATNTYIDSEGVTETAFMKSQPVKVTLIQPFGKVFSGMFENLLDKYSFFSATIGIIGGTLISLPLIVFILLPCYFLFSIFSLFPF